MRGEEAFHSARVQARLVRLERDKRAAGARLLKTLLAALNGGGIEAARKEARFSDKGGPCIGSSLPTRSAG